jgi:GNAT superfamily N-acetyltransferase
MTDRMDVTARAAKPTEVSAVTALIREGRASLEGQRGGSLWLARQAIREPLDQAVEAMIGAETACVMVGYIDEQPLGVLLADLDLDWATSEAVLATVRELFVVAEARGVGLGETMMNATIQWATARGCIGIDGYALPGDRATKNFFETFGLVARGIVVHRRLGEPSS